MIGDGHSLPAACLKELEEAMQITSGNTGVNLVLALSYSGRWEITQAVRQIAAEVQSGVLQPEDIDENSVAKHLNTLGIPDPELLIRTSGEYRLSNFLLWQTAYTEYYFTNTLWPDFDRDELIKAILDYQQRERRFGRISEQIH